MKHSTSYIRCLTNYIRCLKSSTNSILWKGDTWHDKALHELYKVSHELYKVSLDFFFKKSTWFLNGTWHMTHETCDIATRCETGVMPHMTHELQGSGRDSWVMCGMTHVSYLVAMSHVSWVMSHISCVMSHISCVMIHVSCVMSRVDFTKVTVLLNWPILSSTSLFKRALCMLFALWGGYD